MSAICGLVHADGSPVSADAFHRMAAHLAARGPDGRGAWCEGPAAFGHMALHITPESVRESQPRLSEDKRYVLVADARIDNRDDLCETFGILPVDRASMPDDLLILKAFRRWGEECPIHLIGDFCFAVWDTRERVLFCATDHLAARSFLYTGDGRRFVFATEFDALFASGVIERHLDERRLAGYLVGDRGEPWDTFFEGVVRLRPAHALRVDAHGVRLRQFWAPRPGAVSHAGSDDDWADGLRERLVEAVTCRLRSRRPVALALSGGLDSSAVAGIAAPVLAERGERLHCISFSLPADQVDPKRAERRFAQMVADAHENIDIEFVSLAGVSPFDGDLDQRLRAHASPMAGQSGLFQNLRLRAAAAGAGVVLEGSGGDQLASASGRDYLVTLVRRFHWLDVFRQAGRRAAFRGESTRGLVRNAFFRAWAPAWLFEAYVGWRGRERDPMALSPAREDFVARMGARPRKPRAVVRGWRTGHLGQCSYEWASRAVNVGMLNIEGATPMVDRRVIDYCVSVPEEQFALDGVPRSLARRAIKGIVPEAIRMRPGKCPLVADPNRPQADIPHVEALLNEHGPGARVWEYLDRAKVEAALEGLRENGVQHSAVAQTCRRALCAGSFIAWLDHQA